MSGCKYPRLPPSMVVVSEVVVAAVVARPAFLFMRRPGWIHLSTIVRKPAAVSAPCSMEQPNDEDEQPPLGYEVRFAPCSAVTASNEVAQREWKAHVYDDGAIYWEVRRFILAFLAGGRKDFEVAKILRAARGPLTTVLEEWGLSLDNEILPSFKAASCRGEATMLNAKGRGEWTSSTPGALAWLLHLSCASHRAKSKEQAKALLRGFLVAFASPASAAAHSMAEDIKQALSSCQQPPQGHWGSCCHLRIAIDAMLTAGPAGQMWTNLTKALQHIYLARPVCVASRRLLAGVLQRLCQDVDGKVSDMQPPKNFSSFSMPQGRKRKLRIDEDYKRYLVSEAVAAKRAHCGAQYAKTTGDVHPETARKWDEAHMANYIAAAWHTMGSSTLVSLACDASKVGNPAEETVMFLAWDMESNKAVVLPPQAA